jgi:hypothetical protein
LKFEHTQKAGAQQLDQRRGWVDGKKKKRLDGMDKSNSRRVTASHAKQLNASSACPLRLFDRPGRGEIAPKVGSRALNQQNGAPVQKNMV